MRTLADGLWCVDFPTKQGFLRLGTRSTIARLADGLWVHSPGPFTDDDVAAIRALGPVRSLVAPNLLHHLFLAKAAEAFPEARIYGVPGLREKTGLRVDVVLDGASPWPEIDLVPVDGAKMGEIAFLHRPSRTLLLTDLAFNVQHSDHWPTRLGMTLNDGYGRFGPTRTFRVLFLEDRARLRSTVDRLLGLDFDRITVTHGEVVADHGRQALEQAFAWLA